MSCGVGHRCSLDPALLWLWYRLVATALIRLLTWEPPYASGVALEKTKQQQQQQQKQTNTIGWAGYFSLAQLAYRKKYWSYSWGTVG